MDKLMLREGQQFSLKGHVMTIVGLWSDDNILLESDRGEQLIKKRDDLLMSYINDEITSTRNFKDVHYKGKIKNIKRTPTLTNDQQELIKRRLEYVKDSLHVPHGPLLDLQITKTQKRIKDKKEAPCKSTVWEWINRYIESNYESTSLLPKIGNRGKWERYSEEERSICEDFINSYYMQRQRRSVADTILTINAHIEITNRKNPDKNPLKRITRCLFERILHEKHIAYDIDLSRWGKNYVTVKYRGVLNPRKVLDDALYMGGIDHTELDLKVKDERGRTLERPNFTFILNDTTRCVMGFYVGFTPPGDLSVSKCLKHSLMPKNNLKIDFPEIENEWLAFGPLGCIKVDNAFEFHSITFETICSHTNTEIHYCPRKQPWRKGEIERYLKEQNSLIHLIPGTTFSNHKVKGDYNSDKEAFITLKNLKLFLMKWIVDVYHQRPHSALNGRTPHEMWRLMVDQTTIPLITDLGDIDYLLSKGTKATVSHKGVRYDNIWYSSRELIDLRKECGHQFKATIRYSDDDLDNIWVVHPKNEDFALKVPSIDYEYTQDLNRFAHAVNKKRAAERGYPNSEIGYAIAKMDIENAIQEEKKLNPRIGRYQERPTPKQQFQDTQDDTDKFSFEDLDSIESPVYGVTETVVLS